MKNLVLFFAATLLVMLSGCNGAQPTVAAQTVYTQSNMWYVNKSYVEFRPGISIRTPRQNLLRSNYLVEANSNSVARQIPVNSAVEIVGKDAYAVFFKFDGKVIALKNADNNGALSVDEMIARTFGTKPADLSLVTKTENDRTL